MEGCQIFRERSVAQAPPASSRGIFGGIIENQGTKIANGLIDGITAAIPQFLAASHRALTSASDELIDFVTLFTELYKQLQLANNRESTLWTIHELDASLTSLLNGSEAQVIERLRRMSTPAAELRAAPGGVKQINGGALPRLRTLLLTFQENLSLYREILEGKKEATREDLKNLRFWLMRTVAKETHYEHFSEADHTLELTDESYPTLEMEQRAQIDAAFAHQAVPARTRLQIPSASPNGDGILDVLRSVKENCEGIAVSLIGTLSDTIVSATARKASELLFRTLGWQSKGCISHDDLDKPTVELRKVVIHDKRTACTTGGLTTTLRIKNVMDRPLSVGRLIDIFSGCLNRGESDGLYELWGRFLLTYFVHLEQEMGKLPPSNQAPRIQQRDHSATLADIGGAVNQLRQLLSIEKPEKTIVQETFRRIGELMNKHPLLILNFAEIDLGSLLGEPDRQETGANESLVHRVSKASTKVQTLTHSEILTKEEEETKFHSMIQETGELGHLFSLYQTILILLGGDFSSREKFNEIYLPISKTEVDGSSLSAAKIQENFQEQLIHQLIDNAGDVWIVKRLIIKFLLPLISWVIGLGIGFFIQGINDSVAGWLENMHLGRGTGTEQTLDRLKAASKKIATVAGKKELRELPEGETSIFSRGLLEDPSSFDGRSVKEVYSQFTYQMVDNVLKQPLKIVEALNRVDNSIVSMIGDIDLSFVRTALTIASYIVRAPLWIVTQFAARPLQFVGNWIIVTSLKKFLVYIGVVEKAVTATNAALTENRSQRTEITPIIDKTMLGLLETVMEALFTNDAGEHVNPSDVDFKKFASTPEQRRKLSTALGSIFDAVEAIERMETGADERAPLPVFGEFKQFMQDHAKVRGLNACSDVAIGALQTLLEPRRVLHIGNLVLRTVSDSLKASGSQVDLKDDDELRDQIYDKMKQLVALSTHIVQQTLSAKDPECDLALTTHVNRLKSIFLNIPPEEDGENEKDELKLTDRISSWRQTLQAYCQSNDPNVEATKVLEIRGELFKIWKNLQRELIYLENDQSTKTASLNVHKRDLKLMISALEEFQNDYMRLHEEILRKLFLEDHPESYESLQRTSTNFLQIQEHLDALIREISADQFDKKLSGINDAHIRDCTTQIAEARAIIKEIERTVDISSLSSEMGTLIEGAKLQLAFLSDLKDKIALHAKMIQFVREALKELDGPCEHISLREAFQADGTLKSPTYLVDFTVRLKQAFPDHQRASSKDHEIVVKIETALRILEGTVSIGNKRAQVDIVERILEWIAIDRENSLLDHLELGVHVTETRARRTLAEFGELTAVRERLNPAQLVQFRQSSLRRLEERLTQLKTGVEKMTPPAAIHQTIDADFMTVPLLRQLLQTANSEMAKRLMGIHAKMIANQHIATFMALRLGFLPAISRR